MPESVQAIERIKLAVAKLNKAYDNDSLLVLAEDAAKPELVPTKIRGVDKAIGGGVARGRITMVYGPKHSSKSTFCLHILKQFQALFSEKFVLYIDFEHNMDAVYMDLLGIDSSRAYLSHPTCAEEGFQAVRELVETGDISAVVIDSVPAAVPKKYVETTMHDRQVGTLPAVMAQFLRTIVHPLAETKTTLILINQVRPNINMMYGGPSELLPGGEMPGYSSDLIVRMKMETSKSKLIKDTEGNVVAANVNLETVKNKHEKPFKTANFKFVFGEGIDLDASLVDDAITDGVVAVKGSWYYHGEDRLGQGYDTVVALVREDEKFKAALEKELDG